MVLLNLKRRIFLFLLFQCTAGSTANIISTPPVDAGGCYGGLSAFYCGSDRSDMTILHWHINSDILTNQEMMIRGISIDTTTTDEHANSTLSIIGLPINDGILVGCTVVVSTPPYVDTVSATFTVSDIPPVEDLNIVFNDSVMIITWTEPSQLPIHYTYTIIITDDYNQTLANTNTTDSLYTLPLVSVCTTNYTVSVSVVDTSGYTHEVSTSVVEPRLRNITADLSIRLFNQSVRFVNSTSCYIDVKFEILVITNDLMLEDIVLCYGKDNVDTFIENILPPELASTSPRKISLLETLDNDTNIGSYSFGPFSERVSNGSLSVKPRYSDRELTELHFSTFHVQNFAHIPLNGTSELICTFAENSTANGCNVTLTSSQSENNMMIHIPKTKDETTATRYANISGGNYSVSVFDDIVSDGSEGPALIKYVTIQMDDSTESSFVPDGSSVVSTVVSPSMSSPPLTTFDPQPTQGFNWYPVVVGSVCGVVLLCLVVVVFLLVCFVKEKKKKRAKVAVQQERAMVGIYNRNKNDYEPHTISYTAHDDESAVVISIPGQQVDDDGEDFQLPSEFVASTSYQVQNEEEALEAYDKNDEGVDLTHDLSNNVDASLQSSADITTQDEEQSSTPYVSSNYAQKQFGLLVTASQPRAEISDSSQDMRPHSNVVMGGARLDNSQYAEIAHPKDGSRSNEQRLVPRVSEPAPPLYSIVVPTNVTQECTKGVEASVPLPADTVTTQDQQQSLPTSMSTCVSSSDDTHKQLDLPVELVDASQPHAEIHDSMGQDNRPYSNMVVGRAIEFSDPAPTIPAGPKLDNSQYVEIAHLKGGSQSNEQRPIPRVSEPPPLYSIVVPTMNHSTENTQFVNGLNEQSKPDGAVVLLTHQRNEITFPGSEYLVDSCYQHSILTFYKPGFDYEIPMDNGETEYINSTESFDEEGEPQDGFVHDHSQIVCDPWPYEYCNEIVVSFPDSSLVQSDINAQNYYIQNIEAELSPETFKEVASLDDAEDCIRCAIYLHVPQVSTDCKDDSVEQASEATTSSTSPLVKLYKADKDVHIDIFFSIGFTLLFLPKTIMCYWCKIINLIHDGINKFTKMCYNLCNSCGL